MIVLIGGSQYAGEMKKVGVHHAELSTCLNRA
jgi:ATP-dependent phosphoenolpyruvate carboxykinase